MSVQRVVRASGEVKYKARVKVHGRQVAARAFDRRADAAAWEREQLGRLQRGDWIDPRRSRVTVESVADSWLRSRSGVKRRTRETDELAWRRYVAPRFATRSLESITSAEVTEWAADLVTAGRSAATARRAMSVLRSVIDHAISDDRLTRNVASTAKAPRGGARREGQILTWGEVELLASACRGPFGEVIVVLAHTGLRWGELAGLQVGDRVVVPGQGLRVQRAVLAGGGAGELFVDSLKTHKARTVPLTARAAEIVQRWSADRDPYAWMFASSTGTAMREGNWKRQVQWTEAKAAIGKPDLRVHDLRHTAASLWLATGADPKVVQRILGHASATMTMDLYGHLVDANLWDSAKRVGDHSGTTTTMREDTNHG